MKLPPVSTDLPAPETGEGGAEHLLKAVQRELAARGYDIGAEDGKPSDKTRGRDLRLSEGPGPARHGRRHR